jgi:cytochrome c-type biogenesis protein CcmH/NrfG
MLLGNVEAERGKVDEAKSAFQQAITYDETNVEAYIRLARLAMEKGETKEAQLSLEKVLAKNPANEEGSIMLGDVFNEQGKQREAIKWYEIGLKTGGDKQQVLMKLARLQLQIEGLEGSAIKTLVRVIKVSPNNVEAHCQLGLAFKDQGRKAEARNELETCLRLESKGDFSQEAKETLRNLEKD